MKKHRGSVKRMGAGKASRLGGRMRGRKGMRK